MNAVQHTDAELVGETLSGNRDAFSQIVVRYQSLVCALAYSATGNLGQSEDLAQETFITAWKHLSHLRERDKLRSWLGGIARNRINNFLRREGREPVHQAEPLETAPEARSPEALPVEYIISREEQAILWHTLERIPPIYREPLVLFYREHQSVERVAQALELSEDAVHQRLSRGRKMLQEQVLAFVEGALGRTNPGQAFTLGVLAVLPALSTAATTTAAGTVAAKGGAMAQATGLGALLQGVLKIVVPLAPFVSLGGWLGYKMGRDASGELQQRKSAANFWSILLACLFLFVLLPILLRLPLTLLFGSKENLLASMRIWLDIMFAVVVLALMLWIWQRRKSSRTENQETRGMPKTWFIWSVVVAMILAGAFFALALSDSNWKVEKISTAEAQKIITTKNHDAQFFVMRFYYHSALKHSPDHYDQLWIKYNDNGKLTKLIAPAEPATLSLLTEKGIQCPLYVQGRDFEIFGWQGKLLMGLFLFILPAGAAVLLTLWFKNKSKASILTTGNKIGIAAAVVVAALIVTPLVWFNHQRTNSVQPNQMIQPTTLTTERATQAKQTARDFFEALEKADWNKVDQLCPPGFALSAQLGDENRNLLNGLKLVSLGEPFTKPPYPGVYVPYKIQFKNGESKQYNLAVRQDNPAQTWYWDGGL